MIKNRGLFLLVGAAGLGLLAAVLMFRSSPERPVAKKAPPKRSVEAPRPRPAAPPVVNRTPAPAETIARAMDCASLETTYRSYRSAMATDNKALQKALKPVLERDRETAIEIAETDLLAAGSEQDRDIVRRTLESLRR